MGSKIEAEIAELNEEIKTTTLEMRTTTDTTLKSDLIKLLTAMREKENILLQQRQGGHVGRQSCMLAWHPCP
jgi:hypothetical protein